MEGQDFDVMVRSQQNVMKNTQTEMVTSRQAQEVQMMMVCAKRFPRDTVNSYARIIEACKRRKLASEAMYEYPRGGQRVTGPSIRMAEVLAQNWGNLDYGIIELEQKHGHSEMMAYCWDMETNVRQVKTFTVKHVRKAGGNLNRLDDPRDIYEMTANQGARRVRACILGVIPGDIVEDAIAQCEKTLIESETRPLQDRIRKMTQIFKDEFSVSQDMIEKRFGCKAEALSERDMLSLKKIYTSLKEGMAKPEDYFDRTDENPVSDAQKALEDELGAVKPAPKPSKGKAQPKKEPTKTAPPKKEELTEEEPLSPGVSDEFILDGDK